MGAQGGAGSRCKQTLEPLWGTHPLETDGTGPLLRSANCAVPSATQGALLPH